MRYFSALVVLIAVSSCVSDQEKMARRLQPHESLIEKNAPTGQIPDSVARLMHDYAVAYPTDPKSEKYLYLATLAVEYQGAFFDAARWSEEYVKLFPNTPNTEKAMIAAAMNYERSGTFDKAIQFFSQAADKYPKSPMAEQNRIKADLLRKGLTTPEEQLNYILKHRDSAAD